MDVLSVALAFIVGNTALAQQPPNLVPNGDMELDDDSDGMADHWAFAGNESVKVQWAREEGADGGHSQRLTCTAFESTSPASHAMLCQVGTVRLQRGKTYRLSFRAKADRIRDRAVKVAISDMDGWHNCGLDAQFIPTREWRTYEFDFRATRTVSDSSRLQFWYTSTGSFWLDDVVLAEAKLRPRRYTEVVADVGGKNKVPNGGFECGAAGWGSVASLPGWGGGLNTLVGELDDGGLDGGKCLKIALSPRTAPVFYFDYFELYRVPVTSVAAANRGWITLQPGEQYVLSAFMRSDPPGLTGTLSARFSSG
ncbi:MAG: carbohydrate binding domain-containing protein, partial [Armatimonadota bacterium]